jgi:Phage tail sheath protein subtilisin-like domain/Phage tail sheath C-terminal domain
MAFQLSPGVNVTEIDLTTVVPAVATSDGAFAGVFRWGPIGQTVLVDSENQLVARFAKPTNFNPETFFTAANFLSYANRLWISRAANTGGSTPWVTAAGNTSVNAYIVANTTALNSVEVGMYVTQSSNASVMTAGQNITVVSKNSSAIVLSSNPLSNGAVGLYFGHPGTAYTAVAFDSNTSTSGGIVANLVNQIVLNDQTYSSKDGTFDADIAWVAKYPGALGNSLRIGVCDNATSFQSSIALSNSSVNTMVDFRVGSNVGLVMFSGATNASANSVATLISIGDQILSGNSSLGMQYLQITGVAVSNTYVLNGNTAATASFDGNASVNSNTDFIYISGHPFSNGETVVYSNAAGNSVVNGLTSGTNYYVVAANSSAFQLSTNPYGSAVNINATSNASSLFVSNTNVLVINFEDPYRLRQNYVANTLERHWEFFNVVETAPGQSDWQLYNGNTSAQDELHVVVVDEDGQFTGTPGTVLETFKNLSRATDAKTVDGSSNYYKDVINQSSQYVWWAHDRSVAVSNTGLNLINSSANAPLNSNFSCGADGFDESSATLAILGAAYDMFQSPEDIDISLVLQGKPIGGTTVVNGQTISNFQLANYLIDNLVETRKDCIALISPDKNLVLNNLGNEAVSLKNWRGALHSSSYAVMDSGYKYQYDKYNDLYRWVPLNGDIAGTCVRTDNTNDAWWSPAGYNRGQIKNSVKLAWNPRQSERDVIYSNGVNPVITSPGQGTVLFGDKTLQAKPSAFDRINVRRLFIVLEKAISTAAKYSLFEFNDAFTRAQFKNLVTPYLRTVQGRRGITDFLVVCDDTNNTPQVVDSNQFVGDIYIKPARSINFIQLNFVAVPSGVQFSEVVGKF